MRPWTKGTIRAAAAFCVLSVSGVCATQWTARELGYQPQLGSYWPVFGRWRIYPPWRLLGWSWSYGRYAPSVFAAGQLIAAGGVCLGAVAISRASGAGRSTAAKTYGSARWASAREVACADLHHCDGVYLGRLGDRDLRHAGVEHVIALAPTRSGKGVGLVIPTLLTWRGSVLVHDIKGENWAITAGWRSSFSRCLLFDPTNPASARYNPLAEVRRGAHEVRDAQGIADILVDPDGGLERRSHWDKTSHSLLVGAILHVLYAEADKSLAGVAALLSDTQRSFEATLRAMMATDHLGDHAAPKVHPVVATSAQELLNKSENERSGVLSTALSFLGLYRDPLVAAATSCCDFHIADLIGSGPPLSLYLAAPPSDLSRTRPLMRLMLNQIARRLTERLPTRSDPQLLLMLDEFAALGRLEFFETALAYLAGFGIRAYIIVQSVNQLTKVYGEYSAILDNCHIRIVFACNDERAARRVSDALGVTTQSRSQRSHSGDRFAAWLSHLSISQQETARPLLTLGEIMQLPHDEAIVMVGGMAPIRAKKLRYFERRQFTRRLTPPPPFRAARVGAPRVNHWNRAPRAIHPALVVAPSSPGWELEPLDDWNTPAAPSAPAPPLFGADKRAEQAMNKLRGGPFGEADR